MHFGELFMQSTPPRPNRGPLARTSPRAPAARPKAPKGRGQALGPPVAMYFHKKRIEIT